MSELDKEFDAALLEQLNEKLLEAAKAMKEVNEIRTKLGLDSLILSSWSRDDLYSEVERKFEEDESLHEDEIGDKIEEKMEEYQAFYDRIQTGPLESELGRAGWSTSSSYC